MESEAEGLIKPRRAADEGQEMVGRGTDHWNAMIETESEAGG